eukprot:493270_1
MSNLVFWDDLSETLLVTGVAGSCISLIIVLSSLIFVIYHIIKKNGSSDTEISQTSSMVMQRSGKNMLRFVIIGLIVFLLPPISYAFLKSDIILGNNFNPFDICELSWFLEYFGYEVGKLMISIFLIYRLYASFDNSLYHVPKKHVTYTFFIFIPLLVLLYIILVLLALFLPDKQFGLNITYKNGHIYCGYNYVSIVFVFCHIAAFIREIGFGCVILYGFISRLHAMNMQAKGINIRASKKVKGKKKKMSKKKKSTKTSKKKKTKTAKTSEKNAIKKKTKHLQAIELENDFYSDASDIDDEESQKKKTMTKDLKFNMLERRGLIIRYVILIVIMIISSVISQILLCVVGFPTFYISFDIIIQTVCLVLILWISQGIWYKMVNMFYCICLCKYCCPVFNETEFQRKTES